VIIPPAQVSSSLTNTNRPNSLTSLNGLIAIGFFVLMITSPTSRLESLFASFCIISKDDESILVSIFLIVQLTSWVAHLHVRLSCFWKSFLAIQNTFALKSSVKYGSLLG